jgi:hypothetical protein
LDKKPLDDPAQTFLRSDVLAAEFPLQKQQKFIVIFALLAAYSIYVSLSQLRQSPSGSGSHGSTGPPSLNQN